jgi:uncharacterized protein YxjI
MMFISNPILRTKFYLTSIRHYNLSLVFSNKRKNRCASHVQYTSCYYDVGETKKRKIGYVHEDINKGNYTPIHNILKMLGVRHYRIDQELKSSNYKYSVRDIENKEVYTIGFDTDEIDGNLTLSDVSGKKLLHIYQKDAHIHLTYNIYSADDEQNTVAIVERTGLPLHHKFKIESPFGQYKMERKHGGFSHDYVVTKDDQKIADIYRKPPEKGSYAVDINQNVSDQEDLFLLAFTFILWCAHGIHYLGYG